MLTISREAPVKVGKHAWNVFPLEAFGFLLGSKADGEVYAALPCSKTKRWYEFEDRWTGIYDNIEKARFVGKLFDMDVVGFYASTEGRCDDFPMPAFIRSASMELIMLYRTECCPQHSWASFKCDNRWLIRDEDYVVPRGKRIRDSINQKRILKEWHRVYGTVNYSNKSELAQDVLTKEAHQSRTDNHQPLTMKKTFSTINPLPTKPLRRVEKWWCSACMKKEAVRILFGYPSFDAFEASERGEIWLGGCCLPPADEFPQTHCLACGHENMVKYETKKSLSRPSEDMINFGDLYKIGARVLHPTFGKGVVTATAKVESLGESDRVQVKFDSVGSKWLALKFAKLALLGVDDGGGMNHIEIGNTIEHPEHGSGVVTYVGDDYIGVRFNNDGDALLRRSSFERKGGEEESVLPTVEEQKAVEADLPWPDSTFTFEDSDAQHFMGSHWDPFVEDSKEIFKSIPEILPQALLQTGYGEHYPAPKKIPADWTDGYQLVWPLRVSGMSFMVRANESQQQSELVSFFPFFAEGSQAMLTLRQVDVWEGECEAQISAGWGEAEITFFDTQYLLNRAWYEAGKRYDFILTGLAYSACPSTIFKIPARQNPEQLAWMRLLAVEQGEEPQEEWTEINLTGMAMFLPADTWDKDDYKFRAPIKQVKPFQGFLGQDGWRVRATVFRFGGADADLDIVITRRVWDGDAPPQVGQDIEGTLWLQGHLWYPHK